MTESCGDCRLCCKLLAVEADDGGAPFKPFLKWCVHAAAGVGCKIYPTRPKACRTFECSWLVSQRRVAEERMAQELRPDRCHVIFGPADPVDPEHILHVHVDPHHPRAWTRADVKGWLERIVNRGVTVVLSVGHKHTTLRKDLPNMKPRAGPPAA